MCVCVFERERRGWWHLLTFTCAHPNVYSNSHLHTQTGGTTTFTHTLTHNPPPSPTLHNTGINGRSEWVGCHRCGWLMLRKHTLTHTHIYTYIQRPWWYICGWEMTHISICHVILMKESCTYEHVTLINTTRSRTRHTYEHLWTRHTKKETPVNTHTHQQITPMNSSHSETRHTHKHVTLMNMSHSSTHIYAYTYIFMYNVCMYIYLIHINRHTHERVTLVDTSHS
jgi:hypothetical protein